jgi:hypothetical protein
MIDISLIRIDILQMQCIINNLHLFICCFPSYASIENFALYKFGIKILERLENWEANGRGRFSKSIKKVNRLLFKKCIFQKFFLMRIVQIQYLKKAKMVVVDLIILPLNQGIWKESTLLTLISTFFLMNVMKFTSFFLIAISMFYFASMISCIRILYMLNLKKLNLMVVSVLSYATTCHSDYYNFREVFSMYQLTANRNNMIWRFSHYSIEQYSDNENHRSTWDCCNR